MQTYHPCTKKNSVKILIMFSKFYGIKYLINFFIHLIKLFKKNNRKNKNRFKMILN